MNQLTMTWRVCVLELKPTPPWKKGWLYDGETSVDVDPRIQRHQSRARNQRGGLYSEKVVANFKRRREDLETGRVLMTREASLAAERELAGHPPLRSRSYSRADSMISS